MGKVARSKAAARHARAVVRERAHEGAELVTPAAMRSIAPPELVAGFRYRTIKRMIARALGIERKRAGPVFVGRRDMRHNPARARKLEDTIREAYEAKRAEYVNERGW